MEWKKSTHHWRLENNGKKITKDAFARILESTLDKMSNIPDIVKNGFKTCGLVPFCANNIKFLKYFKDQDKSGERQDTGELQRIGEDKQQAQKTVLEILEGEIPGEILESFKQSGEIWEGAIQHTSLFMVWRTIVAQFESDKRKNTYNEKFKDYENESKLDHSDPISTLNNQKEIIDELDITNLINTDNLTLPIIFDLTTDLQVESPLPLNVNTRNLSLEDKIGDNKQVPDDNNDNERNQTYGPSTSNISNAHIENIKDVNEQDQTYGPISRYPFTHSTPIKSLIIHKTMIPEKNKPDDERQPMTNTTSFAEGKKSSTIPTPFKKSLFWPESKTDNQSRKPREKIPAVTTSSQWQQYFEKKEMKKKQDEELKLKRKLERERKSVDNENKKKKVKNDVSLGRESRGKKAVKRSKKNVLEKNPDVPSSSKTTEQSTESWYCCLCDTERKISMRLCHGCYKYYHEECIGLTKYDKEDFFCPSCDSS